MIYEFLRCTEENRRKDVKGNTIPFDQGGDPKCSPVDEINSWLNFKKAKMRVLD